MAANEVYNPGEQIAVTLAGVVSGGAVVYGQIPGVALNNTDDDGKVTICTVGVWNLLVTGAVTAGAIVYLAVGTPNVISTTNTGVRFGYALDALAATGTTRVKVGY